MKQLIATLLYAMTAITGTGFSASSLQNYDSFRAASICGSENLSPPEQDICECLADHDRIVDAMSCIEQVKKNEPDQSDLFKKIQNDLLKKRTAERLGTYHRLEVNIPSKPFERTINRDQILKYINSHSMHF